MPQPLISVPTGEASAPLASVDGAKNPSLRQLWLAVHLPQLPLAVVPGALTSDPMVVIDGRGAMHRIVAANAAAVQAGVSIGSDVMTALAVCHRLKCYERSTAAEQALLDELATWAWRLTSLVNLEFQDALLLEVGGSVRLFDGLAPIRQALSEELVRRKLRFSLALAPTRLAALWLARSDAGDVLDGGQLRRKLGSLPIGATRWPDQLCALLHGMGIRRIGECLRLSREGITLRAGKRVLLDLDRALGKHIDVVDRFVPTENLSCESEFMDGLSDAEQLTRIGVHLIHELGQKLRQRHAQVRQIDLVFHRHGNRCLQQSIVLAEPTQDVARLTRLFLCRMERLDLDEPVVGISCRANPEQLVRNDDGLLFDRARQMDGSMPISELVELLRERLNHESVCGVQAIPNHRPEKAWRERLDYGSPAGRVAGAVSVWYRPRPLWLLAVPKWLSDAELFADRGSVRLESEPERIESGWWESAVMLRDYYVARTARGEFWWIYRERRHRRWYLHGLFG